MSDKDQLTYLKTQIARQIAKRKSSANFYRNRHYFTGMITVFISALITVLAGFKSAITSEDYLRITILFLGAISTVVSAWGGFFSPGKSWLLEGESHDKLRALQTESEFAETSPTFNPDEKTLKPLFDEFQKIMDEYNKKWQSLRKK